MENTSWKEKITTFWNRYKKSKTAWIAGAVFIVILVLLVRKDASLDGVTFFTVTETSVTDAVLLSGRTQSASAVDLGFADQGRIASVSVKEGDKVYTGQVLARLDTADLQASLSRARADLVIARLGASQNKINLDNIIKEQDSLVASAYRKLLSTDLEAIPNDLGVSAPTPTITGSYQGTEGIYEINLYPSNAISGVSFSVGGLETGFTESVTANTSVPLGSKGLFIRFAESPLYANTKWKIAIPNTRSALYSTNLSTYQSAKATRDRVIADAQSSLEQGESNQSVAQAKIDQAQSSVDSILAQIEKRTIRAPFNGVVASNNLKPGQSTSSVGTSTDTSSRGSSITLISENDYEVVLKVPEISIAKLSSGQLVDITLDAYGAENTFTGKITAINPAETIVDGVPIYETKVLFAENDSRIRSGMTATAQIVTATKENVLAIPASYITNSEGQNFVTIVDINNNKEKRMVTLGLRGSDSMVEIISGLNPGEKISSELMK